MARRTHAVFGCERHSRDCRKQRSEERKLTFDYLSFRNDYWTSLLEVSSSTVSGNLGAVWLNNSNSTVNLATSRLSLPAVQGNTGTTKIVNSFDSDLNPIPNQ